MNSYDDLSIDRLFRLDGDVAFVTGGGDGFGRIAWPMLRPAHRSR